MHRIVNLAVIFGVIANYSQKNKMKEMHASFQFVQFIQYILVIIPWNRKLNAYKMIFIFGMTAFSAIKEKSV